LILKGDDGRTFNARLPLKNPLIDRFLTCMKGDLPNHDNAFIDYLPKAWSAPHASWRKVLLLQPPTKMQITYRERYDPDEGLPMDEPEALWFFDAGAVPMSGLGEWIDTQYPSGNSHESLGSFWLLLQWRSGDKIIWHYFGLDCLLPL
jgi:hypothetical protein